MASHCSLASCSGLHNCRFLTPASCSRYRARYSPVNHSADPVTPRIMNKIVVSHHKGEYKHRILVASLYEAKHVYEGKDDQEELSQATLLWRAIKLPIYSVALVPLTVASSASYFLTGQFSARRYTCLLASSISIITWLNLSNDVYDFDTGADKNKKESVVNMSQSRTGTLVLAYILLALGLYGLTSVAVEAGSLRSILLLICAVMCGYMYQCPPFRLSYHGLGEPLCFAAFGPFATTAFYLIQANSLQPFSGTILALSVLVGFTTTLILFCSHFHQLEGDKAVGKFSPLVRTGTQTGTEVVKIAILALYALTVVFSLGRLIPFPSGVFCLLTIPVGNMIINFVRHNHNDNGKIFMAKYFCVRLHALYGLALASGLILARKFSNVISYT